MFYFVKTPWWLKKLYHQCVWDVQVDSKVIYLSFDDGPHPVATPFVLDELRKYNAKATFFCIGKNVTEHNNLYNRILQEGHSAGNHTFDHLKGWKTADKVYVENTLAARNVINSSLFRPPYGKIKRSQIRLLRAEGLKIIMWSVLSGDFDKELLPEKCFDNVIKKTRKGSIIVFHDSEKAFENLGYSLPLVLKYFSEKGFSFEKL